MHNIKSSINPVAIAGSNGQIISVTVYAGKTGICEFIYGSKTKTIRLVAGMKYELNEHFNLITGK